MGGSYAWDDVMVLKADGNVGIGTDSPDGLLTLKNTGDMFWECGASNSNDRAWQLKQDQANLGFLSIRSSNANDNTIDREVMTFDRDGNVGIGTTTPGTLLEIEKDQNARTALTIDNNTAGTAAATALTVSSSAADAMLWTGSSSFTTSGWYKQDGVLLLASGASGGFVIGSDDGSADISFWTNTTERVTIDGATGNVGIGKVDPGQQLTVYGDPGDDGTLVQFENSHVDVDDGDNILMLAFGSDTIATEGNFIIFRDNNTSEMGYIKASGDGTISVNGLSDYRIKENIKPITKGLDAINLLKPIEYNKISSTDKKYKATDGFIAHEVQEAGLTSAVTGIKDETKTVDGKIVPKYQTLTMEKMIPTMVKAIQELSAKVTALENA